MEIDSLLLALMSKSNLLVRFGWNINIGSGGKLCRIKNEEEWDLKTTRIVKVSQQMQKSTQLNTSQRSLERN
ncbi:hypothetical protein M8C21_030117, partial [Ambrosia artemisiifolia]